MATSVIPKSEMRKDDNIRFGYGEVPAITVEGVQGWGLPGGKVVFTEKEAIDFAEQLDLEIRTRLKNPKQLISAGPL